MLTNIILACAAAVLGASSVSAGGAPTVKGIRTIVAFGDSLTDTGRATQITAAANFPAPGFAFPPLPYASGRFTNGPTYIQVMAANKNLTVINEAVGGATTNDAVAFGFLGDFRTPGRFVKVPGVNTQIAEFKNSTKAPILCKPNTLALVWSGANDNFNNQRFGLNQTGDFFAKASYENWVSLSSIGTRNILTILPARLGAFENQFGDEIIAQANRFRHAHPRVRLEIYDSSAVIVPVAQNPAAFGFDFPITASCCSSCTSGLPPIGSAVVCANPDKWVTWDNVHPTAASHRLLAAGVEAFIGERFGF
ncbi:hypothetical protein BC829DRAFT_420933 [Chytridium lagenaria]|nr:hypothetical protein BC829DRAFT_420933 [Chytridium lagenaria]